MRKVNVDQNTLVIHDFDDYAKIQDKNTLCIQRNLNELVSKSNGHGFVIFLLTAAVTGIGYYTHKLATKLDKLTEDYHNYTINHSEVSANRDFEEDLD